MALMKTFAEIARVGPIHSQAETVHRFLTDHGKAGVAIVSLPEEMAVTESALLERELTESIGISVDRVYVNALYEERFTAAEAERIRAAELSSPPARAAARAALSHVKRAEAQREQLRRLESMVEAPIATLPFLFQPELSASELDTLAARVV